MGHALAGRVEHPHAEISLSVFGGLAHSTWRCRAPRPTSSSRSRARDAPSVARDPRPRRLYTGWSPRRWSLDPLWFFLYRGVAVNPPSSVAGLPARRRARVPRAAATRMNANKATIVATKIGMVSGRGSS
jgi:hypothetical protein